ncbi:hypothetical protein [Aquipseudomonas alcaligenes]|uniref:Uncharacterized protein n=1 Tax=Aquipseudomonas alcaligenes TaxID=43263 RepID=A0AA37FIZ2_AQUAC|nr:hypothetical protein [Pseudomonas alcaligenes]BCR23791.1 hypothetical protein KAM426_13180 [Pseudomonas alcaligenes]GIZ65242.1 hypothetical protein KAM428_03270 [Pseudomonas alcaligenes]GIZ69433.1 hypothetical protein KAM429_01940 [Pseudomonas alcaligenes]GIZ73785.1 hypothetical protein KAM430_01940 [Pseudomonas alcaligenes]GIZ78146.1 hypothetical protein KAM432_01940 [Pseudomonas alcaligenes]
MIFAEMLYPQDYWDFHKDLESHLLQHFEDIECGLQSDSWFWIKIGGHKVAVDTFSAMKHQIKCVEPGAHVQQVIDVLKTRFAVNVYPEPVPEGHEDFHE